MLMQRSVSRSAHAATELKADAQILACVCGTIFGLPVVPDVSSSTATSAGLTVSCNGAPTCSPVSVKRPAAVSASLASSMTRTARGYVDSGLCNQGTRSQISEISVQFLGLIGRVHRDARCMRRHGEDRHRHLRTIWQHYCDA